ncbi:MAG: hypothetical protein PHE32_01010 [Candidatus Shapirobacteria bacterium]|nr:hypothetical protein [Candidatus Shapirobacteria bacterium]MDD4410272.1 hypothetical protein [Candidatus Shapirobacteria bacterium]
MPEKSGGEFLNIKYPDLQKSEQVQKSVEQKKIKEGVKTPNNPKDRNEVLLERFERIFENPDEETRKRNINLFTEKFLYPEVLIDTNNVPENYFELQKKIARERGHGDVEFDDRTKKETGKTLYDDQKKSLDVWINYLSDKNTDYPTWFKYYTLRSVLKMGNYDKEKHEFGKRTKNTTNIFPDLNREALSYSYDTLSKHYLKGEKHDNDELNRILESARFDKIYAFAIDKATPVSKENKEKTEGEWTKYNQGDDATPLYESLQGHGTNWCTAGEETARRQLKDGDFYVYYTKDENNRNTIPRIAIRMENGQVAEVRGVADKHQNLEGRMTEIAREKYSQLPGGEKFDKKDQDMKLLTLIDKKTKDNQDLTKEELKFLYEIDNKIEGFGYQKDPRIEEIKNQRNTILDLNFIFEGVEEYSGNLDLRNLQSAEGLVLPEEVGGDLRLDHLKSAEGLVLPKKIGISLFLLELSSNEGLVLPKEIKGNLFLNNLISTEGLALPEEIGCDFILGNLQSAEGLVFPREIGGSIDLSSLKSAEGLVLPEKIGGDLQLRRLQSAEGLVLPKEIGGDLQLGSLRSAEGLVLPKEVGGSLDLHGLQSAEGLVLPEKINGNFYLHDLESAEGLVLPKEIGGDFYLGNLRSAEGLVFPKEVGGSLDLNGLKSAEGLVLPEKINGNFYLHNLESAEGLVLPKEIGGDLQLARLKSVEGLMLSGKIGNNLHLNSLQSAEGLVLPEEIKGNLNLDSLELAEGLVFPKEIGGDLRLNSLQSAEGLVLSKEIGKSLYLNGLKSAEGLVLPEKIGDSLTVNNLKSFEGIKISKKSVYFVWSSNLDQTEKNYLEKKYPRLIFN